MTQKEYLEQFEKITKQMLEITKEKNSDYAGLDDAFKNFKLTEFLGVADTARGILVRMTDKLQRIANLIDKEGEVKDESINDTLIDLANYSIILNIFLQNKKTETTLYVDGTRFDPPRYCTTGELLLDTDNGTGSIRPLYEVEGQGKCYS